MRALPLLLTTLSTAAGLGAQISGTNGATGVGIPGEGLRMWGGLGSTDTHLVDTAGQIVQTYPSNFGPGAAAYLEPDGVLLRTARVGAGFGPAGDGGGLQRIALDGSLLWDYRYEGNAWVSHHDIERLPNGNVLMIAWGLVTQQKAFDNGRDPAITPDPRFWPDHVIEVKQTGPTTGEIVWEWYVMDHLIQDFDATKLNFGVVGDHPELIDINYPPVVPQSGDWNHLNGMDYCPINDIIILSNRESSELWVIDHSTSTEEASGHIGGRYGKGGDLIYRWGNPEAYDRGGPADQTLFGQHAPQFIPEGYPGAGNILVFNNQHPAGTRVYEFTPPMTAQGNFILSAGDAYGPAGPVWEYSNAPLFNSPFISSAERMPNGNTLINSGAQGWMFEVDVFGQIVWQYVTNLELVFHSHYYEKWMWTDTEEISLSNGGVAQFDLIAGSQHSGSAHFVLGSLSGTSPGFDAEGFNIPLNPDSYFRTTLSFPNVFPLANSLGILDPNGRAVSNFSLPGSILPPALIGLEFSHAFVVANQSNGPNLELASNPVTIRITP